MTIRQAWQSPRLIPVLTVVAVVSLLMSTYVVVRYAQAQSEREKDRIDSDLWACGRVNVLRGQTSDGLQATATAIEKILDRVIPDPSGQPERDAAIAELERDLDPVLDELHTVIDDIDPVDCIEVVPRATRINPTTTPGGNP